MKKEIQIFEVSRSDIKGVLRGILNINEIVEKLANGKDDFYFLYENINDKITYNIYTPEVLKTKITRFGKYIKPYNGLKELVNKINNINYCFNNLVETTIGHETFCTSINGKFFNKELKTLLYKVNIDFSVNPNLLEEYISFNVNNKTFAKFSTRGNYKKTKKFKVESKIFVEAVKRVLEEYYDTNIILNENDPDNWEDATDTPDIPDIPAQKSVYYLMEENKKGRFILPITFEDEESAEKHIRDYLSIPETIGSTISIMKKGKSLTNEIQIKELTNG